METLGKEFPSYSAVKKWAAEFRRRGVEHWKWWMIWAPQRGHHKWNHWDCAQSGHVWQEAKPEIYSQQSGQEFLAVQSILTDILGIFKVSARWVPRMLTEDQKRSRAITSRYLLYRYEDDPEEIMDQVVTQDETWEHHFDLEFKKQGMEWKHPA